MQSNRIHVTKKANVTPKQRIELIKLFGTSNPEKALDIFEDQNAYQPQNGHSEPRYLWEET